MRQTKEGDAFFQGRLCCRCWAVCVLKRSDLETGPKPSDIILGEEVLYVLESRKHSEFSRLLSLRIKSRTRDT